MSKHSVGRWILKQIPPEPAVDLAGETVILTQTVWKGSFDNTV